MALLRHRDESASPKKPKKPKIGIKKMASIPQQPGRNSEQPELNLNPGPKTTLVSGIVDQLIKSGYKGDLMSSAGMSYTHPESQQVQVAGDQSQDELREDIIVDDINFNAQNEENQSQQVPVQKKPISQKEMRKRNEEIFEERAKNSYEQIEKVSKNARNLYGHIDEFIVSLREAAGESNDNPRLGQKLENLRRMCVGFVRSVEQQMPNYATSLFVNTEENNNGQR